MTGGQHKPLLSLIGRGAGGGEEGEREREFIPLKVRDSPCIAEGTPTHVLKGQHKTSCLAHTWNSKKCLYNA